MKGDLLLAALFAATMSCTAGWADPPSTRVSYSELIREDHLEQYDDDEQEDRPEHAHHERAHRVRIVSFFYVRRARVLRPPDRPAKGGETVRPIPNPDLTSAGGRGARETRRRRGGIGRGRCKIANSGSSFLVYRRSRSIEP